jgi:hypothetical protein
VVDEPPSHQAHHQHNASNNPGIHECDTVEQIYYCRPHTRPMT